MCYFRKTEKVLCLLMIMHSQMVAGLGGVVVPLEKLRTHQIVTRGPSYDHRSLWMAKTVPVIRVL